MSGIDPRLGGTADISRWRNHRIQSNTFIQLRRGDRPISVCRPSGAGNRFTNDLGGYARAPPPANFRCASGAKTCVETLARPLCVTVVNPLVLSQTTFARGPWLTT